MSEGTVMMTKPEEVGFSAPRLDRIRVHLQRYIDAGKVSGTLTLVARHGQIAYFEPQGHLELERVRPMQRDTIFRIYSMTKTATTVAVLVALAITGAIGAAGAVAAMIWPLW